MIKAIQNIYHYYKYGEVIHKSPTGKVIRKKTSTFGLFRKSPYETDTTKTVLDKNGVVEVQLNRYAYNGPDMLVSVFDRILPNEKSTKDVMVLKNKEYSIKGNIKKIIDFSKKNYIYQIVPKEYMVSYGNLDREVTTIVKNGPVLKGLNCSA